MNLKKILTVVSLVGILALVSCDNNSSQDMTQIDMDREGRSFIVTVHVFDSDAELQRKQQEIGATSLDVDGFAQWNKEGTGIDRCDVYVLRPNSPKDFPEMQTWGHEFMHCVYGSYHK